jgi:nitroimidazol reductase NimA-like FMN-containing flavoprotein (pyridoxamine 5'-phosphate oxidase superfamily)
MAGELKIILRCVVKRIWKIMRHDEKEIKDRAAIDQVIHGSSVCHLAMARDNTPYVVPLSFGYDSHHIYFHCAPKGLKCDFLRANPRVCFQMERDVELVPADSGPCRWTFHFESVVGYGIAEEISTKAEKRNGLDQIMSHYGGSKGPYTEAALKAVCVWRITIASMTGKRSPRKNT